jgi:hypothetical protein
MTCRDVIERLGEYASRESAAGDRRAVDAHLMRCDRCLRYLSGYELTVRAARRAFE